MFRRNVQPCLFQKKIEETQGTARALSTGGTQAGSQLFLVAILFMPEQCYWDPSSCARPGHHARDPQLSRSGLSSAETPLPLAKGTPVLEPLEGFMLLHTRTYK